MGRKALEEAIKRRRCSEGISFVLAVRSGMPDDQLVSTFIREETANQIYLAGGTRARLI
jgi:predicted component of type VI protein secretion system